MTLPPEIAIISGSPIIATALQHWLESGPEPFQCRILGVADLRCPFAEIAPDVILIAPQHWREMSCWLPGLRKQFPYKPWIILTDLRLSGMFSSFFEGHLCSCLSLGASPRDFRLALWVLTRRQALHPPATLMEVFACSTPAMPPGEKVFLTAKEFQCGCAVSLGLTNVQIAEALHMAEGTVKSHLHHTMRKLHLRNREKLADYFASGIASLPLT